MNVFDDIDVSDDLKNLLGTEEAKKWVSSIINNIVVIYDEIYQRYERPGKLSKVLLSIAVESAYVDLKKMEFNHKFRGGPSVSKTAASIAYWINKIKPIQVEDSEDLANSQWLAQINSVFAVNFAIYLMMATQYASKHGIKYSLTQTNEIIFTSRSKLYTDLVYYFTWRDPSFKDLIVTFDFIHELNKV